MSASWASSGLHRATILLVTATLAAGAAHAAPRDSARAVAGVRVSDEGIRFQGGARVSADSADAGPERVDATIDVGGQRVRVRGKVVDKASSETGVRVDGPVVVIDDEGDNVVRLFADAEVPAGQRIEGNVVAVFGSVTVRGQVAGDAVAVFGSVRLAPGAVVDGDAVAVGGALERDPTATVSGQSVAIEPGFGQRPRLREGQAAGVILLVVLGLFALTVLLGLLWFPLAPDRMLRVAVTATQRPFVSILMGVVAGPLVFLLGMLALITVVGIPIAILLPFAWMFVQSAGTSAALQVVGCRLLRRPLSASPIGPYLAGALFVAVLIALGVTGTILLPDPLRSLGFFLLMVVVLLATGISLVGIGAVLLSRMGSQPRQVSRRNGDLGAAPGAAYPGAGI